MDYILLAAGMISLVLSIIILIVVLARTKPQDNSSVFDAVKAQIFEEMRSARRKRTNDKDNMKMISDILADTQKSSAEMQDRRLRGFRSDSRDFRSKMSKASTSARRWSTACGLFRKTMKSRENARNG